MILKLIGVVFFLVDASQPGCSSQKRQASSPAPGAPPSKKVRVKPDKFQDAWKSRWTWLSYGGPEVGMHCTKCKSQYPSDEAAFIGRGCKDFKTSSLIRHANSKKHLFVLNIDMSLRRNTLVHITARTQLADDSSARLAMETSYFCAQEPSSSSSGGRGLLVPVPPTPTTQLPGICWTAAHLCYRIS